jgi:segregation and condensation protein B
MEHIITSRSQEELDSAEEKKNLKKIEAAMFISARFLSVSELVELTDINPLLLRELLEKLKEEYNERDSSIEILNKEELWKMDIRQEYFDMINRLATGSAEFTRAEQETLAIIAYKQPVKQSVIIKIRGNKAYEHVKHFIELGLVRSKRAGHTLELNLSEQFYDYFHLEKKKAEKNAEEKLSQDKNESEELELKEDKGG